MATLNRTDDTLAREGEQTLRYAITPKVDVYENADAYLLVADLPGVGKDDLHVSWSRGELTLEGHSGPRLFRRAFTVPDGIDADRIGADLVNGVLRLTLPKVAAVKPRKIEVRAS